MTLLAKVSPDKYKKQLNDACALIQEKSNNLAAIKQEYKDECLALRNNAKNEFCEAKTISGVSEETENALSNLCCPLTNFILGALDNRYSAA